MRNPRQIFLDHLAQTSDYPLMLEIEKAEGLFLYTRSGKRYWDLISGIAVSNLGHRHPRVMQAIHEQLDAYTHVMVYGELIQGPQNALAQTLCKHLPPPLDNVYFVNSGTEATEGAIKLAKRYTGRYEIISARQAYHGSTQGALSLGEDSFSRAYRPLIPGIDKIWYGSYRDLDKITENTAAVILETIQGESGVISACAPYFQALREKCTQKGTLLILDEIQCGMGRTGSLWAFEQFGIVPDILLLAKSLGGGMPLGAFISSRELMQVFKNKPVLGHITTFGGHPVSCAAGKAAFDVLLEEKLSEKVEAKARLFREKLQHPKVIRLRQKGLLMALEVGSFDKVQKLIRKLEELGVLSDWFLYCDVAIRLAPPLIIEEEQIEEICALIQEALAYI